MYIQRENNKILFPFHVTQIERAELGEDLLG